jgi:mRNA interferase MazF
LRIGITAAGRLREPSDLLIDQLRAIDSRRLVEGPLLRFDDLLMGRVAGATKEVLDQFDDKLS